jgi:ABC-type branched-subunit amino acid transport system ATPase component/ABC-type branched-subunit amino acid transport system permease subunit
VSLLHRHWRWPASLAVVLLMAGVPPLIGVSDFRLDGLNRIITITLVAIGLNIVTGFAGQLSLGPGAVFAVAGYTAIVLADHYPQTVNLPLMCLAGVAAAAVVGLIAAIPALRVSGFYLGMTTLFLAILVPKLAEAQDVTGSHNGISLISNVDFTQNLSSYALYETVLGAMLAMVALSALLLHSRVGRRFTTLRTSEVLAESLGTAPYPTKLVAFLLSSVPAGLGGALYVYSQQLISPASATISPLISINLLAACVIGGFGTVWGPVVGSAIVLGLDQYLGGFQQYEDIVYGIGLIAIVLLLPQGLMGVQPAQWLRQLRGRGSAARAARAARGETTRSASGGNPPLPLRRCRDASGELDLAGISKRFGGVTALGGVDLRVAPGRLHALIGPNGSGKTTLLNVASGFYRADRGSVAIGGRRVGNGDATAVARAGVGRTFQTPKLIAARPVLENVLVAADTTVSCLGIESVLRLPRGRRCEASARQRALQCVDHLGLAGAAALPAGTVPHGMQRLVEIARAVASDPLFLLLDEPAAGLSPAEIRHLGRLLRELADAGVGVLLVEHNMPFVLGIADEVTVLHRGQRLCHGTPDEVRRNPEVMRVYLGAA